MAARTSRLGVLRTFASAAQAAARPGSPGMLTRIRALPRLARAISSGEYSGASLGSLVGLLVAGAYVVSPVDLVPEGFLSVLGLGDDTLVLAWAAAQVVALTEDFLQWEGRAGRRAGDPATVTVEGRTVR